LHALAFKAESTVSLWDDSTPHAFHKLESYDSDLGQSIMSVGRQSAAGVASGVFNCALPNAATSELVANLGNQLLRNLGYSADLKLLRSAVNILVTE
jgi:hypothetical protein